MIRLRDIFVPGGQPTVTYVDRSERKLEESLQRALDKGGALISITGPTKCGKTVLCRKVLEGTNFVWLDGGEINRPDDFWDVLIHKTNAFTDESVEHGKASGSAISGGVDAGIAGVSGERGKSFDKRVSRSRSGPKSTIALDTLMASEATLVVDDFHYLDPDTQTQVVRALKQRIFNGLSAIVLAVPHRAYDAVKVETEMTGRLTQIFIDRWSKEELSEIAIAGAEALNIDFTSATLERFSEEAFSSPHLMQSFCSDLCLDHDIKTRSDKHIMIGINNESDFFKRVAKDTQKGAFERLARGPRQRSDRLVRQFKDGKSGDIYMSVLIAIAKTGPASTLTYEDIRAKLKEILSEESPQAHEITRVLQKMTEIAKDKIVGEPVLEWDEETKILHIIDPFFAYFLRWGTLELLSSSQRAFE